jgi:hypothetical protein
VTRIANARHFVPLGSASLGRLLTGQELAWRLEPEQAQGFQLVAGSLQAADLQAPAAESWAHQERLPPANLGFQGLLAE